MSADRDERRKEVEAHVGRLMKQRRLSRDQALSRLAVELVGDQRKALMPFIREAQSPLGTAPWIKANTIATVLHEVTGVAAMKGTEVLDELLDYREHVLDHGWDIRLAEAAEGAINIVRLDDSLGL